MLIKANTQKEDFDSLTDGKIKNVDVLFVDGDHSYVGAISDYNKLIQYLNPGGLLLMDNHEVAGVAQACAEIKTRPDIEGLGVWNKTLWIGVKNDEQH